MLLFLFLTPNMMLWAQETNKKFAWTTQMFLNEQREKALHPEKAARRTQVRRVPGTTKVLKQHRLIADPDTIGGMVYISCFIHLADASSLSKVEALGVEVEETFDGLDFITARVPVNQLEALADLDNVTRIKVAQRMRPLTDKAREATHVDDLLTQSPDALAVGVTDKYDGTGVVLGIIDTGIDFQHIAFKDKDGNSRIKRAYVYSGTTAKEYSTITSTSPTTDNSAEDHGTHTATTAGGSSVIINGSTVTVTDDHANATYGGMAPGADLYLAGIKDLNDTYLTNALKKMVSYADDQGKPLVVSNSWGSGWGPRDGTGEWAELVGQYFGDSHPNRVILFAASNDAGHQNGNEGGGLFVKKSAASSSSPLGTIIRTDGYGGEFYSGLIACAWNASNSTKLNCKLYVLDSSGTIKKSWTVTNDNTSSFSDLSTYYKGSMAVYIEQDNGKCQLAVYSEEGLESKGSYTLAIEVYPASGSANINMWAGDWSFFTDNYTTSGHTWLDGTDDMCVSDEATIPDAISVGAYATKKSWKDYNGTTRTSSDYTVGDIAYFSSYATAEQSPTGEAYPWISAPGARLAAGVNHYHKASVDDYSYYGSSYNSDLVVNSSTNPYAMMEGTSMATPVAAGIVALWLQAAQEVGMDLTVNDVKDIMEQTAIQDSYTTTGANASHFGKGKIDALAGIQHILGTVGGPVIKATPKSIDFADRNPYATRTYTKTLTVKGLNLEGGVTATLTDANGVYTLSGTSITQAAAAAGAELTITYAPLEAGTHEATITLSSANATDVVVNLTATAKPATPTIIADPEALTFLTEPDESKNMYFDVLSEFLEGDITVTLNDANGVFSIDRTIITKDESEEGATLTVTFQSADTGTFNGTVTLSSAGAENVVISLTATASLMMDETVDYSAQGYSNGEEVSTVNGNICTITFDKGSNSNTPKYYDTGSAIRVYGGNTMTIASDSKTIVGIALTFGSGDGSNAITTNVGSYSNGTWTGSASSVTFTIGGTSGHRRIQSVTITYAGGTTPIVKQDVTMAFNPASATATIGESFTEPTLTTNPTGLTVTYSSSNESVATVQASTGKVTLVSTGTAVITATFAGNDTYNAGSASYTLTVTDGQSVSSNDFALISSASDFVEGDYIIVFNNGAMNTTVSSSRLQITDVTPVNNTITTTDASIIWHIAPSGDYYTIYNAGENKYAASNGTKNQAQLLSSETDDKSLWSVTTGSTFDFTNKFNAASNVNATLRRNGTFGFACYSTSTGGALSLYKRTSGTTPVTVAAPTISGTTPFNSSTTVTITAEAGATIYYTIDGSTPTTASTLYTSPFTLTETTTVKAIAVKDELTSAVTTQVFMRDIDPTLAYYHAADGKQGEALKTAMSGIIYNRTEKSYDYLWTAFQSTDVDSNGKIWDMYSNITHYTPVTTGSSYSVEGDCYNREHSFPQSWFGGKTPMNTDLHHIYPTDGFVNGKRANYPFGETNGNEYKSANDFSKLGTCTYPGYTGIVFEPADEYKGDFARTYFYMVTCYEEKLADWYSSNSESRPTLDGSTYPGFQTWQLNMLMKWAKNDPVSEKETNRNNAVYTIQNNRNPFIDYPGLEEYIWGTMTTTAFSYDNYVVPSIPVIPPVTVPTLAVNEEEVTTTSASVSWDACDNVTAYTLQLATDEQFSTGSTGTEVMLVSESFESEEIPDGWSASSNVSVASGKAGDGTYCIAFKGSGAYLITPLLDNPSSISFIYKRSSNTAEWGLDISYSTSTSGPWTTIETISGAITTWQDFTQALDNVGSVYIKLTDTRNSGAAERYVDLIQITGIEPSGDGSLISSTTVNGTSYTFTGLNPETTYYARVKGNAEWSNVVNFTTCATLTLGNNDDNTDVISAAAASGKQYDVTLAGRTLYKDGDWNTLCLPFTMFNLSGTIFEDATVMELGNSSGCNTGFDESTGTLTLDFVPAFAIEAGHAYIVKWTTTGDPIENPVFEGVTISDEDPNDQRVTSADGKVQFTGTYSPILIGNTDPGNLFIGSNNALYTPQSADYTLMAFRAIFHVDLGDNEVKAYHLRFGDEDPTIVTAPLFEREGSTATWYDLHGRQFVHKPMAKGIYISKGHKIVVK